MAAIPKQLEVFTSIVQLGLVTAATAQLAMSQLSVSKSLVLIEQQTGFSLFERYQGKTQPTAEARALYKEALHVHQDRLRFERFVDYIYQYRVGQLRVCATPALALSILPLVAACFRQSFPDYGVVADMCLSNEIETAVEEGRYDLGSLVKPGYEPKENPLAICRGEMVCMSPGQYPLAQQTEIHWQDISTCDLVYIMTDARLAAMIAEEVLAFCQRQAAVVETNRYNMATNLARHGNNSMTTVGSFSLQGVDTSDLAARPFRHMSPVSVVAVTDGHSTLLQPGEVFAKVTMELMIKT